MAASAIVGKPVLQIEAQSDPIQVILHCSGKLVRETSEQWQQAVRERLRGTNLVVLDFTNINYIDSSGIGSLVGVYLAAKHAGCRLKLINVTSQVRKLLNMTHLAEVLEPHAREELFGSMAG